jgi:acetyl-CoA synthetase
LKRVHDGVVTEDEVAEEISWMPSERYWERSRVRAFYERHGLASYEAFYRWSIEDIGRYWSAVVDDLGLRFEPPFHTAVDLTKGKPWAEWFVGGGFNYVEQALQLHADERIRAKDAVIWEGDDGEIRRLTFDELARETGQFANALRGLGVEKGDRVGLFLPMTPEAVVAVLACGAIGAVCIPMFSGYGAESVATRLRDSDAKVLITADGFSRRGKLIPMKSVVDEAIAASPSVELAIVLKRAGNDISWNEERDRWWHDVVKNVGIDLQIEPTSASDPYMIIYTSGTTGRPKGALHVHAGFPVKAAHDLAYCFDLHDDDTIFWLTDLGWMMGPWLIGGGLMLGATIVLYEGTPDYPDPDRLWRVVERHQVSVLGLAPTAVRALMTRGDDWPANCDLSSLRILGSTGETWNPVPWSWFYKQIGHEELPIMNYSGGTETGGGIVGCVSILPIRSCGFSGPVPGMDADVVDDRGEPIREAVGELVLRQPWVGMTRGFWNDNERYINTYWSRFPDTWVHGDWAEIDADGAWYIRGRSDDTLKVAGKRIGPAEIESAAVAHGAIQEAAAIGIPHDVKGESLVVFAVLRPGCEASPALAEEVRQSISHQLGASMRPEAVHFVSDLPRTRNAKIMRRVIRSAYLGAEPGDLSALENPTAVEEIVKLSASSSSSSESGGGPR